MTNRNNPVTLKRYYEEHKEAIKKYHHDYYIANKEKARLASSKWQQDNKDKVKIRNAKWRKSNPDKVRKIRRVHDLNSRTKRKAAEGRCTKEQLSNIYNQQKGRCYYCDADLNNKYHIEHKIPLSRGGSNWPENICCSCADCNLRKGTMTEVEFINMTAELVYYD